MNPQDALALAEQRRLELVADARSDRARRRSRRGLPAASPRAARMGERDAFGRQVAAGQTVPTGQH